MPAANDENTWTARESVLVIFNYMRNIYAQLITWLNLNVYFSKTQIFFVIKAGNCVSNSSFKWWKILTHTLAREGSRTKPLTSEWVRAARLITTPTHNNGGHSLVFTPCQPVWRPAFVLQQCRTLVAPSTWHTPWANVLARWAESLHTTGNKGQTSVGVDSQNSPAFMHQSNLRNVSFFTFRLSFHLIVKHGYGEKFGENSI